MAKKRYYVVWSGVEPGIYESWEECEAQIKGVKQALYESFDTLPDARKAYSSSPYSYIGSKGKSRARLKALKGSSQAKPAKE